MSRDRPVIIILPFVLLCVYVLSAVTPGPPEEQALRAARHAAHPLRTTEPDGDLGDLRPLGRMVGDAKVVGLGEATHSSHQFFTLKHRVLRYLVAHKGFRTFALETSWSTGLRLDRYVRTGKGDPRRIMRTEFQDTYAWWNTREYLALVEWMRAYDVRHTKDQVRFMGDDFAYAGPELYESVLGYARRYRPELLPRLTGLYRGLRPATAAGTYMKAYLTRPLTERRAMAARTRSALSLLERQPAGAAPATASRAWAVQNARAISQTAQGYAFDFDDPAGVRASMRYRDHLMADNVAWWQKQTGLKVLLSAHDNHVAYRSSDPRYPRMQGSFLRQRLGTGYVSVGTTFGHGSFNATGPDNATHVYTLSAPAKNTTEHFLDRVSHRDYLIDLRATAAPARTWLDRARPTRSIGTAYPEPAERIAPARSYDLLIHLHHITPAHLLATPR
ncbi:erythromycin esterase family protein [Streptomyces sp. 8L]|uniref:erythromycin esterase family protein n=1 Tax=Streptomyces sp. 8L TaxID=2877242 RepID=UPI001CD2C0D9|nr:erythromycin esterase family protein [Streptomyces sp. 8L]MCA1217781.1 erythromycin esterase family protein [Streptomyces sp. 8L]